MPYCTISENTVKSLSATFNKIVLKTKNKRTRITQPQKTTFSRTQYRAVYFKSLYIEILAKQTIKCCLDDGSKYMLFFLTSENVFDNHKYTFDLY